MVTIKNEDLRSVYHHLITINNILQKETQIVNKNKSHVDKIVPEQLANTYSTKHNKALEFVDNLIKTSSENSVVCLVATFERVAFAKYRTSYGNIRAVVRDKSMKPLDYFRSRERFVHDQIDNLAGIISLLDGIIDSQLIEDLKKIKDHRNYIAHGKRVSPLPIDTFDLDKIATTLDDVIFEIEN